MGFFFLLVVKFLFVDSVCYCLEDVCVLVVYGVIGNECVRFFVVGCGLFNY